MWTRNTNRSINVETTSIKLERATINKGNGVLKLNEDSTYDDCQYRWPRKIMSLGGSLNIPPLSSLLWPSFLLANVPSQCAFLSLYTLFPPFSCVPHLSPPPSIVYLVIVSPVVNNVVTYLPFKCLSSSSHPSILTPFVYPFHSSPSDLFSIP